jgi:hypothetical protein
MQTDMWISRAVIVLGLILVASVSGILILMIMGQPLPEILAALGFIAAGGLVRLLISPLNQKFLSESGSSAEHTNDQPISDEICVSDLIPEN